MDRLIGTIVFLIAAAVIVILMLSGCSTVLPQAVTQQQKTGSVFRDDIQLTVNGVNYDGVGVIPAAPYYDFQITSKVDVDMLEISSCGRDFVAQAAMKVNWLHSKRTYAYQYQPQPGVEDQGSCLLRITAANAKDGQNAFGLYDFKTAEANLNVQQMCNGSTQNWSGVSMCQTKVGIRTQLAFPVAVEQNTAGPRPIDPKCQMTSTDGGKTWNTLQDFAGECVTAFIQLDKPHYIHRHTERRYTDVLIRED